MSELLKVDTNPPSGTRDFLPEQLARREDAIRTVQEVFSRFGFQGMQTPAFERLEVLTGKYGEDEKLIFKIQKRGERAEEGADLALRYDLTVPLARFMARYRSQLPKIFRRFQIGPVWRADRPSKGRFREFLQCDVDVVGAKPPMADAEVILVLVEALAALGLEGLEVKLNSRKALAGLMEACGVPEDLSPGALITLDKLDKAGAAAVEGELIDRGIPPSAIQRLRPMLDGPPDGAEGEAEALLKLTLAGEAALNEVKEIRTLVEPRLRSGRVIFSPLLARGLNYYTGMIFEIYVKDFGGAIAAGGRYDNLLGMFMKGHGIPACGGSIGLERILELLESRPAGPLILPAQVLVTVWDESFRHAALRLASAIRERGVAVETYLGTEGIRRQIGYASERGIPFALIQGPDERSIGTVLVKDLASGVQTSVLEDAVAGYVASLG